MPKVTNKRTRVHHSIPNKDNDDGDKKWFTKIINLFSLLHSLSYTFIWIFNLCFSIKTEKSHYFNHKKALDDIGLVFKVPPPKLTVNPFTGEELGEEDRMSVASSRQSSRSSTSRWGRDGDGNIVKKKQRRNARRDFLLQRLSLTKEADIQAKNKKFVTFLYQS